MPYKAPFGTAGSWVALVVTSVVCVFKGWDSFVTSFNISTFFSKRHAEFRKLGRLTLVSQPIVRWTQAALHSASVLTDTSSCRHRIRLLCSDLPVLQAPLPHQAHPLGAGRPVHRQGRNRCRRGLLEGQSCREGSPELLAALGGPLCLGRMRVIESEMLA